MAVLPTGLSYTGYNGALVQVNGGGNGLSGSVVDGRSDLMPQIARRLKGIGGLRLKAVLKSLANNGSGSSAASSVVRRAAVQGIGQGGLVQMETLTTSTGSTTAGDVTEVNSSIFDETFGLPPSSYPADRSGNGGGGKLGR